jgi:ketosteroid isomerase-like protein
VRRRSRFSAEPASAVLVLALLAAAACASAGPSRDAASDRRAVGAVLDAFHDAAARADETAYFDLLAPNAVFLGTDASERWDKAAFRAFAHPYFSQGKGWTFRPRDRHLEGSRAGGLMWFDEKLASASYGECRGSGVVERQGDGRWKITQYNLTIPIPNDLAKEFVARIRAAGAPKQ